MKNNITKNMPNIKRIAILFQSFCFFHITIAKQSDDDINNNKLMNDR